MINYIIINIINTIFYKDSLLFLYVNMTSNNNSTDTWTTSLLTSLFNDSNESNNIKTALTNSSYERLTLNELMIMYENLIKELKTIKNEIRTRRNEKVNELKEVESIITNRNYTKHAETKQRDDVPLFNIRRKKMTKLSETKDDDASTVKHKEINATVAELKDFLSSKKIDFLSNAKKDYYCNLIRENNLVNEINRITKQNKIIKKKTIKK